MILLFFYFFFTEPRSTPKTIPEPLEPINVQTDVQRGQLSFAAGSSSLNIITSTELHSLHHGPILAAPLPGHERLLHNHMLALQSNST